MRFFLTVFFFFFFFFSEQQTCQIWDSHSFEIWNLIFGWTRYMYKTEHKVKKVCCSKCLIVSVISFLVYFDKQVHKKTGKKIKQAKKNSNLEFCWIKRAPKNKCARQLWDIGFIFFSLIVWIECQSLHVCNILFIYSYILRVHIAQAWSYTFRQVQKSVTILAHCCMSINITPKQWD